MARRRAPPARSPLPPTPSRCALCEREVAQLTDHHLVPRSEGGTETVPLCHPCHKSVHAFFSNKALARLHPTVEALRAAPEMERYLAWIRKQPDRPIRVYKSNERR